MKSLQLRLAFGLTLCLVLVFGGLAIMLHGYPQYLTEEYILTRLQHDAESLRTRLRINRKGQLQMSRGPVAPIYSIPESGHYYVVNYGGSFLKSSSLGEFELSIIWDPVEIPSSQRSKDYLGNPILVWVIDFQLRGRPVRVAIAEDVTHLDQHLHNLKYQYFIGIGLTLIVIIALQALIIRLSLRPIEDARKSLRRLGMGEVERIDTRVPTEIRPLVDEINRLGEVMQKQMKRSRTAIGNLAHAMKTPLSAIQHSVSSTDSHELKIQIQEQLDRIKYSVDRELRRARLSGAGFPGQQFEPDNEIPVLIEVLEKIYVQKNLRIDYTYDGRGSMKFDRSDMLELIGNLLDNAFKWAESRVRVRLSATNQFQIEIEDDGPGIDANRIENVGERGVRLDESLPGHGLGLAIVGEIVEDYEGTLKFIRSKSYGGLKVSVELPFGPTG